MMTTCLRTVLLLVMLTVSSIGSARASSGSVLVEILSLTQTAPDQYALMFKTPETLELHSAGYPANTVLTVEVRYNRIRYFAKRTLLTLEKFRNAIDFLKRQMQEKKAVRLGFMGAGPCKIAGRANAYESDALDILEEVDSQSQVKQPVVYLFCKFNRVINQKGARK